MKTNVFFFARLGNDVRRKKSAVFQEKYWFYFKRNAAPPPFLFFTQFLQRCFLFVRENYSMQIWQPSTWLEKAGFFFFFSILCSGNWNCRAVVSKLPQICLFTQPRPHFKMLLSRSLTWKFDKFHFYPTWSHFLSTTLKKKKILELCNPSRN